MKLGGQIKMGKKLLSMFMIVLILLTMLEPLSSDSVMAVSESHPQESKTTNVALNAKATASGQCNEYEKPSFAVDGRTDTKWCDNSVTAQKWLELDLGKEYNINQWVVQNACIGESKNCPYWNTNSFRLQMSEDGKTWEDIDVVNDNYQTIVDRYVPTFKARYIRLYIDKPSTQDSNARIYELELYGTDVEQTPAYPEINKKPVDYVDPFINTLGDNGQTNPGPTTPFGLVSLGPDSDGGAFSGYYYQDKYLKGFSHLRFSGVGCSGAGGNILMKPGIGSFTNDSKKYKEKYDKNSEEASPGYYKVKLESDIEVELTASKRVGFHKYMFPKSQDGYVLIDLANSYAGMLDASLKVENNNEISGYIKGQNVCGHGYYKMYYSIQFDQDFDSYQSWSGDAVGGDESRSGTKIGVFAKFDTNKNQEIKAKVGLSPISVEEAKYERDHDIPNWNFDQQRSKTRKIWSKLLNKVEITDNDEENKTIFYTQLYHSFLHPNNVTSTKGEFRAARDENTIRKTSEFSKDFEYYSGWTTWDDFRKYSLYSILAPQEFDNIVKSMVDVYKTRGSYVQWGEGYWPSPTVRNEFNGAVILDAYTKGFDDFDVYTALQGMAVDTDHYTPNKVSGALEKAYSAYYPMKLASLLGDKATYLKYREIALSYQDLWNPVQRDDQQNERGFFTPNAETVASVSRINEFAYQGNLWHYRWFVPHDVQGLAKLRGSSEKLADDLEYFFEIDEYMAINEPDIQAPYMFNYLGKPYLTQKYVREYTTEVVTQKYHNHGLYALPIKSRVYRADPEGYLPSMDDDAGAMSSWFVYSAMGLFPGNPGDPYYMIGSPIFSEMTLHLEKGKSFTIKANDVSSKNRYIQKAKLNGKSFDQAWISYEDIMKGGKLEFQMGSTPNKEWGADPSKTPPTTDFTKEVVVKLNSITAPADKTGVAIGTAKTADALGLPTKVDLVTDSGSLNGVAKVTWNVDASDYDPTVKTIQTFTVNGTVTLPNGVENPNNLPLTTSIKVTVNKIPQSQMTATATSQETIGENNSASMAIDGNSQTIWHTKWDKSDVLPQSITLNLRGTYLIDKVAYLPRPSGSNGNITGYNVYVSTDGVTFTKVASGTWAIDNAEKVATFDPTDASYVKLEATAGVNGWASAAEISVLVKQKL